MKLLSAIFNLNMVLKILKCPYCNQELEIRIPDREIRCVSCKETVVLISLPVYHMHRGSRLDIYSNPISYCTGKSYLKDCYTHRWKDVTCEKCLESKDEDNYEKDFGEDF